MNYWKTYGNIRRKKKEKFMVTSSVQQLEALKLYTHISTY